MKNYIKFLGVLLVVGILGRLISPTKTEEPRTEIVQPVDQLQEKINKAEYLYKFIK